MISSKSIGIAVVSLLFFVSCSTTKEMNEKSNQVLVRWMDLSKFPCFGHCAVYDLRVFHDGLVLLKGKEHLDKTGVYFAELSKEKTDKLRKLQKSVNWPEVKEEYWVNLQDLPVTHLTIYNEHGAIIKKINSNSNLPDKVNDLAQELIELLKKEKWTQIQKKHEMVNPEVMYEELIVDLDSSLTTMVLEEEYSHLGLKTNRRVSPHMNMWVFNYNTDLVGSYELLVVLRKRQGVKYVNFNRRILPRE